MKILLLTSEMNRGGVETHLYDLARELEKRGHQITVGSAGGEVADRLSPCGVRHVLLPWNTHNPFRLLIARRRLSRLLRQDGFDLIHAHARLPAYLAAGLAKKRRIPLVTTVHAKFRTGFLTRRLSRWGERTVAVSEDLAQYVEREYGIPPRRITVIPNGIDVNVFRTRSKEAEDKPSVLFLSRLDRDCSRGAELLLAVANRLSDSLPSLEIQIGGGGELYDRLRREADRLMRQNPTLRVRLLGHIEHPERLYPRVQAVVGVSRCALEAMACGVPVILGGNEGFLGLATEETLKAGEDSNFCCRGQEQMTEDKLYFALRDLLSRTDAERQSLGLSLRHYVRENHSTEQMAIQTEAVYRALLSERKTGVLLCGYYGYGNMGDEALLCAAICRAREEFLPCAPIAMTRRGVKDETRFGISCVRRISPVAISRAMRRSSVMAFGGGTLLQDQTSLRSLLYYAVLLRYAQHRGLKTVLWGNGLIRPRTAVGGRILRWALVGCDYIGVRDAPSFAIAKEILGENCVIPLRREPDLVLSYPPEIDGDTRSVAKRLGLSSMGGKFAVIVPRRREGRGVRALFCQWSATLRGDGLIPVVVPMFPAEDKTFCRQLCRELGGVLAEGLTPAELIRLMRESEVVCGMRLHALVFASVAGVPFVGFGTDPKIEAFCRERGGVYFTDLYEKACR